MYGTKLIAKEPTFWLSFVFLATAGVIVSRMILLCLRKYRWLSFNSAFLILCLITCLIRAVFFMFFYYWMENPRRILGLIMFWIPINLQFATFSLLAVFYAGITNDSRWKSVRLPVWLTYTFFNLLFFGAFIASVLVSKYDRARDRARAAITASTFFLLVIALGYYGFRVWRILLSTTSTNPRLHGISPMRLFVATLHIMVIYLSRAIYAILSDLVPSLGLYFGNAGEHLSNEIFACIYFTVWEVLPAIIILILFWSTTPPVKKHQDDSSLPFLSHVFSLNSDIDEEYSYQPLPAAYASSSSVPSVYAASNTIYATGVSPRHSLSLVPSSFEGTSLESP